MFSIWPPADTMKRTIAKIATVTGVMFGLQYISNLKHPITYIVEKPLSLVFFLLLLRILLDIICTTHFIPDASMPIL